jgi:hypothetical protein
MRIGTLVRCALAIHSFHNYTVLQERNIFASKHLDSNRPTDLIERVESTAILPPRGPRADPKLFPS